LLRRGAPENVIDATLEKLCDLNYINDAAFARNWALSRAQNQGWGPRKIEQELRTKGVVPTEIRQVVNATFEQEDELTRAGKVLKKRFSGSDLEEPKTLRRALAFLQRRGYSSQVIFTLLHCPVDDNC
jgi:regulatory protein